MGQVNETLFDLVFRASDFLKTEIESVQNSGEATKDPSSMIAELKQLAAVMKGETPPAGAAAPAQDAAQAPPPPSGGAGMVRIKVYFEDGCQMENIRAFMLISQLKDLCDHIESIPANPEGDSSLCSEIIKNGLIIDFKPTGSVDDVIHAIENSVNIKTYEMMDNDPAPAPAEAAPAPKSEEKSASAPAPAAAPAGP